jgi:heme exporter protein C
LNGAAISILIYMAYVVLRNSMDEEQKRARVASVYNIFAFVMLIVFLLVYPRMNKVDSLHPGNGENPAFSSYDLDSNMRLVFYPAVAGWIMMGMWLANLSYRAAILKYNQLRKAAQ